MIPRRRRRHLRAGSVSSTCAMRAVLQSSEAPPPWRARYGQARDRRQRPETRCALALRNYGGNWFPASVPSQARGMQFSLFGYLYEVVDLTPAMQKASMSLAQKSIVSGGPS